MMLNYEQKIREVLSQARISKAYKGYAYLERAIYYVLEDESRLCHIYQEVYVRVGEYYGVSATAVEKNLRTLRDVFWQHGGPDYFRKTCGVTLYTRPYPREMIELFAEQVNKQMKRK